MKTQKQIIKNTVNSIYMKSVTARKGWTKQEAACKVVDFLTCGKAVSLNEFMEAK